MQRTTAPPPPPERGKARAKDLSHGLLHSCRFATEEICFQDNSGRSVWMQSLRSERRSSNAGENKVYQAVNTDEWVHIGLIWWLLWAAASVNKDSIKFYSPSRVVLRNGHDEQPEIHLCRLFLKDFSLCFWMSLLGSVGATRNTRSATHVK